MLTPRITPTALIMRATTPIPMVWWLEQEDPTTNHRPSRPSPTTQSLNHGHHYSITSKPNRAIINHGINHPLAGQLVILPAHTTVTMVVLSIPTTTLLPNDHTINPHPFNSNPSRHHFIKTLFTPVNHHSKPGAFLTSPPLTNSCTTLTSRPRTNTSFLCILDTTIPISGIILSVL